MMLVIMFVCKYSPDNFKQNNNNDSCNNNPIQDRLEFTLQEFLMTMLICAVFNSFLLFRFSTRKMWPVLNLHAFQAISFSASFPHFAKNRCNPFFITYRKCMSLTTFCNMTFVSVPNLDFFSIIRSIVFLFHFLKFLIFLVLLFFLLNNLLYSITYRSHYLLFV